MCQHVHHRQALAAIDGLGGQFDTLLGVAFEVVKPKTAGQDAVKSAPGQLGAVLKISQQIEHGVEPLPLGLEHPANTASLLVNYTRLDPLTPLNPAQI